MKTIQLSEQSTFGTISCKQQPPHSFSSQDLTLCIVYLMAQLNKFTSNSMRYIPQGLLVMSLTTKT